MKEKIENLLDIIMVIIMFPFVMMGIIVAYTFAAIECIIELIFKEKEKNDLQDSKSKD